MKYLDVVRADARNTPINDHILRVERAHDRTMVVHNLEMNVAYFFLRWQTQSREIGRIYALVILYYLLRISAIEDEFDNGALFRWSGSTSIGQFDERVMDTMVRRTTIRQSSYMTRVERYRQM